MLQPAGRLNPTKIRTPQNNTSLPSIPNTTAPTNSRVPRPIDRARRGIPRTAPSAASALPLSRAPVPAARRQDQPEEVHEPSDHPQDEPRQQKPRLGSEMPVQQEADPPERQHRSDQHAADLRVLYRIRQRTTRLGQSPESSFRTGSRGALTTPRVPGTGSISPRRR